ncbi:hypothetical protein COHA_005734 [Chlorella ohadii]|uniref:Uncharacterized protein n=1 Tax=Chlorella ohadii TaxID=2649997 RepID=A0AAD5DP89_9CHLO|nr:hypothetical protein COHA_005734 [Chlorella ohadii]
MAAQPVALGTLLFSDLQDSPLFRAKASVQSVAAMLPLHICSSRIGYNSPFQTLWIKQVGELDGSLERLKERAAKLTKSAKKYSGALDASALGTGAFAESLESFCGEADEESSVIGGPTLLKFVSTFRELASFQDLLRTQTEVVLCERLNHEFVKVTGEVKDAKRRLDKRSTEYDAARLKHLGHRPVGEMYKGSRLYLAGAPHAAKAAADEARFEVARRFTQVESRKRYEFLEMMVTAVDAHLRYFERGYQLFANLEPYLQHALQLIEKLKADGEVQQARMESLIQVHKAEASARDAAVGEAAAASRDTPAQRPGGPLQMTAGTSALAADLETYIRQTQESRGQQITVLKQGYLLKQTSDFRKAWKRRFFVLDSQGMLYYYSTKEGSRGSQAPRNTCSLLTATIKPDAEDPSLRYAFRVVSPEKEYHLQAENEVEQQEWMQMLQATAAAPGPRSGGSGTALEVLRAVPGNGACCDCGAPDPDWASLNLGQLLCIECSGVHRRLGVHLNPWSADSMTARMSTLSLCFLTYPHDRSVPCVQLNPWSADSDSDDDQAFDAAARRRSSAGLLVIVFGQLPPLPCRADAASSSRPGPRSPLTDKERWIAAKYVDKRFLARPPDAAASPQALQEWLWEAAQRGDVRGAYHAIACGADVNYSYSGQAAAQLVWEANMLAGGAAEQPLSPSNLGHTTVLHAACRAGDVAVAELLLQAGANIDAVEVMRRTPLMYAVLYDRPQLACHLLRRGSAASRDRRGLTAAQLAAGRMCARDPDLAALLARHQQ